jgi:hypothetical protein
MRFTQIRKLTGEPDYSELDYDWSKTLYGDIWEEVPEGIPDCLGNFVILSDYYDANLYHDVVTGQSVRGILHFLNKMPIDWYSKKQATVETATYGSELIAYQTCIDQVVDLWLTLCYLGVLSAMLATYSVTTKMFSRVRPSHMPSFTSCTMHSPFTRYGKQLHLSISSWCTCPVQIILLAFW